jgi:hypothetical protein
VLSHGPQQRNAAADIDAVVLEGDFAGLANGLWFRFGSAISNGVLDGQASMGLGELGGAGLALSAAKWMTLSISGCLAKTSSSAASLVMSIW